MRNDPGAGWKIWIAASAVVMSIEHGATQQPVGEVAAFNRQNLAAEPRVMRMWESRAPGAVGDEDADKPTLTYYPPAFDSSQTAVIVAPGGSYRSLASNMEGRQVANYLNALGVKAFVLKYRVGPRYHHPIPLKDAERAVRTVRARAEEFDVSPQRVGMMGFSAGGHLTSTVGTHFVEGDSAAADPIERVSSRPDFLVLAYPVISFTAPFAHRGSVTSLLGEHPDPMLLDELSSERKVTRATPPTFLFTTSADTLVPPENSLAFYQALRKAGVPAELHVFQEGAHGVGLGMTDPGLGEWPRLLANWLRGRGLLSRPN